MDEPQKHYAKWKKPDRHKVMYDSMYYICNIQSRLNP